jgi:hypothetical protein
LSAPSFTIHLKDIPKVSQSIAIEPSQYFFNMHFATLVAAASASFLLPTIVASPATYPPSPNDVARRGYVLERDNTPHDVYLEDDENHRVSSELERVFGVVKSIPDEVLEKGDDETDKWMVEHGHRPQHDKREVLDRDLEDRGFWDVAKCVGAITAFIASNAIGAAKLLRIKKYIEALGGVREAAELLLKASTTAERLKEGGEALALLAGEILGTSMVSNNC